MLRQKRSSVWPFLVALACLFVLSTITPRTWERLAREKNAAKLIAEATDRVAARDLARSANPVAPEAVPVSAVAVPPREVVTQPVQSNGWVAAETTPKVASQPIESPSLTPTEATALPADATEDSKSATLGELPSLRVATMPSIEGLSPNRPAPTPLEPAYDPASGRLASETKSIWRTPQSLLDQLAELAAASATARWATEVQGQIERLRKAVDEHSGDVATICGQLDQMHQEGGRLGEGVTEPLLSSRLRRTNYALRRRIDIWRETLAIDKTPSTPTPTDPQRLALALAKIDELTEGNHEGVAWRDYLLVDALRQMSATPATTVDQQQRQLARRILARVAVTPLDDRQRGFLKSEPFQMLGAELRRIAAEPVDAARLLECMERYEQTRRPSDARLLADEGMWLALLPAEEHQGLTQQITSHYRNANMRLVLTEAFLNRLIPARLPEYELVRDTVLGNPVYGESLAETKVAVRLIPDPSRLLLSLQISGEVAALTSSTSGPATFRNASNSVYTARKPMEITMRGVQPGPAEVEDVNNVTQLRSLHTDFDGIPLIGAIVHEVARNQHDMRQPEVRQEVEMKTAARAKSRIDEEADARLNAFSTRLKERFLDPMANLSLGPMMIDAKTTEERLTMRLRLGSRRQLGAHTPRPMAPTDCLVSVQVHQTALNNLIEQLELDGQTFTVRQLREHIADRLGRPEMKEERTDHDDDVEIAFAAKDAVLVACDEGRITITLSIARLSNSPRSWPDFQVRASYRPVVDGMSITLVRDGVVELTGRRVGTASQVELRSIFSTIFAKNHARQIMPERLLNHPSTADLAVTQMIVDDGWIAVALGAKEPVSVARKP
jgi:hypothetical protein